MTSRRKAGDIIRREERRDEFNFYTYELLVRLGTDTANFRLPLYSVRISMTDVYGNAKEHCVHDAFADYEQAMKFFEKLVNNLATPLDLPFVLEDERAIG